MKLPEPFDPRHTFVHLGLGGSARILPDFSWSAEYLTTYAAGTAGDGAEGRLVAVTPHEANWTGWERHPAGEELVVVLTGRVRIIHDLPDGPRPVVVRALEAIVNPRGTWHTADVLDPGVALYVTPGLGTEHRPREPN